MFVDDGVSEIDGLLIKLVASNAEWCLLFDGDEDEPVDAGDALVPSGLDMVAELRDGLGERRWRCVLGGLEVDDVIVSDAIESGFDLDAHPVVEPRGLWLDAVEELGGGRVCVDGCREGVEWLYDPVKDTWMEQKLHDTRNKLRKMSMSQIEEQRQRR